MASTVKRKKKKHILRKIILFLLFLAILAGAGYYAYCNLKNEYSVTYDSYTASIGSISNSLSYSGSIALIDSKTYTATSSAKVKTLYVEAGDNVKEGDKLLRMNNGDTITADFDARVNTVDVSVGDEIDPGATLVQIADFSNMRVSIRVDEYDISSVSVGQAVNVTLTATEQTFPSVIDSIDYISQSQGSVAYYTAVIKLKLNGDEGIYPGMQVTVTIPQEEANDVVILKMDALSFKRDNTAFVYVKDENGEMSERDITTGVSNGNYVEIKDGLADGDVVYVVVKNEISSGLDSMFSGMFGSTQIRGGGMSGMSDMPSMRNMSNVSGGGFGGGSGSDSGSGGRTSFGGGMGGFGQ